MTDAFEQRLRDALRAEDPGELFTRRVVVKVESARSPRRWLAWSAGLAASVLVLVAVRQEVLAQREAVAGERAKQELLEALRVTSGKLDLAYEAVAKETDT
jgi:hypothetical protein